jgi:DNA-binding transcriptional ArsR family regulator
MQDQVFYAIADQHRRQILRLIQDLELSSGEIAAHFDVTRPAISQHLRVLSDAKLVTMRKEGTRRLYRARPEGLAQVREFLDEFWGASLERLKEAAENQEKGIEPYGFSRQ